MTLRLATTHDIDALVDLGRRSFVAKFGDLYAQADLDLFLAQSHVPEKIARELADTDMTVAVIETDGTLAAFCKFAHVSTMPRHSDAQRPAEVKQLYADPDLQGRGLGTRLMTWAIEQARGLGADELQLSAYAGNPDAHRFYARFSMVKIADITFKVGNHIDPEIMMAMRL
jgi:GNAT superfamily N-acetyltransferase